MHADAYQQSQTSEHPHADHGAMTDGEGKRTTGGHSVCTVSEPLAGDIHMNMRCAPHSLVNAFFKHSNLPSLYASGRVNPQLASQHNKQFIAKTFSQASCEGLLSFQSLHFSRLFFEKARVLFPEGVASRFIVPSRSRTL
jgi:hypothetical protein